MSDLKTNLVQSADAAARVGVLFVAVAMFAAMWESDSPPTDASNDHWLAHRAANSASIDEGDAQSTPPAPSATVEEVTRQKSTPASRTDSLHSENSRSYPMPVGIAAGDYRVVDSFGRTDTLHVSVETVPNHVSQNARDQYIFEDGDRKIFFIRIHSQSATARMNLGSIRK